jgi:hypothetical protein
MLSKREFKDILKETWEEQIMRKRRMGKRTMVVKKGKLSEALGREVNYQRAPED